MRQIGPLFGVSHSGTHGVIDNLGPLLAVARSGAAGSSRSPSSTEPLVPTRDHRLAAPSKNYRYSANVQMAIDADTRLVIAAGDPQSGNRNDCTVYRTSGIDQRMKCWTSCGTIYRRAASTLADTASGIAHLHDLALMG